MGKACSPHGRNETCINGFSRNILVDETLLDKTIDETTIL
jgi:hypothetical protein